MIKLRGLSWSRIESAWHGMRTRRDTVALERALILRQLRDMAPWTDRKRYASQAAYDELAEYSFHDILRHRLYENPREVRNTLAVLDTFGEKAFRRYGRAVLVRIHNRTSNQRKRTRALRELDKIMRKEDRPPCPTTVSLVLNKIEPAKRRPSHIELVRKLKERIRALETENAQLKHKLRTGRARKRKAA